MSKVLGFFSSSETYDTFDNTDGPCYWAGSRDCWCQGGRGRGRGRQ